MLKVIFVVAISMDRVLPNVSILYAPQISSTLLPNILIFLRRIMNTLCLRKFYYMSA